MTELNIPLYEGFRLRADNDNWIIAEELGKEGKKNWKVFGCYQSLGIGLNDLFTFVLRRSPSKSISDLAEHAERASTALLSACSAIDKWGLKSESAQKVF